MNNLSEETRLHILRLIRQGLVRGEKKLATEREIAEGLTASYATVRLVMKQLELDGFVRKIRGSGTYIEPAAQQLLERDSWRKVWFFHSLNNDPDDHDFGSFLIHKLQKLAPVRAWRMESVKVGSHDEFLFQTRKAVEPGDALIYLPPTEPFSIRQIGELSRFNSQPLVILDSELGDISICNIVTDNRRGGMLAAQCFLEAGLLDLTILLCEPPSRQIRSRIQGFSELAGIAGVEPKLIDCRVGSNDDRVSTVYHYFMEYLKEHPLPEAIFAVSDAGTFGLTQALRHYNLRPGRDVSLIGFDGLPCCSEFDPPLYSVAQPVDAMLKAVFDALDHWHTERHTPQLFSPTMLKGKSLNNNRKQKTIAESVLS